MPLTDLQASFEAEVSVLIEVYEELATTAAYASASDFSLKDNCVLEGLLSRIWQSWNRFCRQVLLESCLGSESLSGPILSHPSATTEQVVSSAAIRAKDNARIVWQGSNALLRREPTWGDVDVLVDIVNRLAPSNALKLLGFCTMATPAAKVLQTIRNAAAHENVQTIAELWGRSVSYSAFAITHPCQALFWVDSRNGQLLLISALEDLKDSATFCVL